MKNRMRRLTALVLVLTLLSALCLPGYAAGEWWREYFVTPLSDYSISDDGVVETAGSTLVLTSDVHQYPYLVEDLLATANSFAAEPVGLISFGGDFANDYVLYQDYMSILKKAIGDTPATYTKGNHEGDTSDADFILLTGMSRIGETAVNEDDNYYFFNFGSPGRNQEFLEEDIATLETYLQSHDDGKPIFIVSHYPLHYYNDRRQSTNADKVIDLLNQYPQAIFFWGHNHTEQDPCYGTIRLPGDLIQPTVDASSAREINFTYVNLGALRDGVNSANGVMAEVSGSTVTFSYLSLGNTITDETWIDLRGSENSVRVPTTAELSSVTVVDTADDLSVIDQATLLIDRPLVDKAPAADVSEFSDKFSASGITWGGELNGGLYDFSTAYTAYVTLTAEEGYTFAPDAVVSVNKEFIGPMPGYGINAASVTVSEDGKTAEVVYEFPATVNAAYAPVAPATELVEGDVYVAAAIDENVAASYLYDPTQHGEESMPDYTALPADVVVREGQLISEVTADTVFVAQKDAHGYLLWSPFSLLADQGATTLNFLTMSTRGGELGLEAAETAGLAIYNNWNLTAEGVPYLDVDGAVKYLSYAGGKFGYVDDPAQSNVRLFPVGTSAVPIFNTNVTVTAPVPGEAAVNEATATAGTVESVVWDAETFGYDTEYTVTVTVTPGDELGAALTARVNGNAAAVDASTGKLVITYTFPATASAPGAATALTAVKADAIESGKEYVIVANGKALTGSAAEGIYMGAVDVTVDGDKITSPITQNMIFKLEGSDPDGYSLKNGDNYLAGRSVDNSPDIWGFKFTNDAAGAVTFAYKGGKFEVVSTGSSGGPGGPGAPPPPPGGSTVSNLYENNGHFNFSAYNASDITIYELKNPFTDVKGSKWYAPYVNTAARLGLMKGESATGFNPDGTMTRAMAVEVIYRIEGSPAVSGSTGFTDLREDAYYINGVVWATQNGIIKGISADKFSPDDPVTREMFATMVSRYLSYKGYEANGSAPEFTDMKAASNYAKSHIEICAKAGIVNGYVDGSFKPKAEISRAEAAKMLVILKELIG